MGTFHDCETGIVEVRELNTEELAIHNAQIAEFELEQSALKEKEADKAALLARLGITADEAKLLG